MQRLGMLVFKLGVFRIYSSHESRTGSVNRKHAARTGKDVGVRPGIPILQGLGCHWDLSHYDSILC